MMHVPFNGSSPSLTALMGGQVQLAVDTVVASTPLIKSGKIKAIAALSPQRLALLPNVPTVAESGYPGFDMGSWFAFVGPAGLPAPVQKKLEKALAETLASAEFKKKMVDIGLTPLGGNGDALRARIERELPLMRAVAARADIRWIDGRRRNLGNQPFSAARQVSVRPFDWDAQPARKAPRGRVHRKVLVVDLQRSAVLPFPAVGNLARRAHLRPGGGDLGPCAHKVHAGVVAAGVVHHLHIGPGAQAHTNLHRCVVAALLGRRAGGVVMAETVELGARMIQAVGGAPRAKALPQLGQARVAVNAGVAHGGKAHAGQGADGQGHGGRGYGGGGKTQFRACRTDTA